MKGKNYIIFHNTYHTIESYPSPNSGGMAGISRVDNTTHIINKIANMVDITTRESMPAICRFVAIAVFLLLGTIVCCGENPGYDTGGIYIEGPIRKDGKVGVNLITSLDFKDGPNFQDIKGKKIEITAKMWANINGKRVEREAINPFIGVVDVPYMPFVSFFIPLQTDGEPLIRYNGEIQIYDLSVSPKKLIAPAKIHSHEIKNGYYVTGAFREAARNLLIESAKPSWKSMQPVTVGLVGGEPCELKMQVGYPNPTEYKSPGAVKVGGSFSKDVKVSRFEQIPVFGNYSAGGIVKSKIPPFYCKNLRISKSANDIIVKFDADLNVKVWPEEATPAVENHMLGLGVSVVDGKRETLKNPQGTKVYKFLQINSQATKGIVKDLSVRIPLADIPADKYDSNLYLSLSTFINVDSEWESSSWSPYIKFTINDLPVESGDEPGPRPQPTPVKPENKETPKLDWLNCPATTDAPSFKLKVGVKSSSAITNSRVLVNGSVSRGIKVVKNDGYDMMIDSPVQLSEGSNEIVVEVTNAGGTVRESRTVIYNSKTPEIPSKIQTLKKIALIIGNASYPEQPLRNTINDATAIASELKDLGFEVISLMNGNKKQVDAAINELGGKAGNYDVAMFYYAGHGVQYKGDNYLIPIDAELSTESDIEYECTNVNRLLSKLEDSRVKMKIVALDACRNNPFERSWHRGVQTGKGLSVINAPVGTFISYATSPGTVAADGAGEHSPYTAALLETLKEKDLPIENVFKKVAAKVFSNTKQTQSPWYASSLFEGEFIFNPSK